MVGHTHEDVDQFFSHFAKRLTWNPAKTIPALLQQLEQSFSPTPTAITVDKIYKIKEWIAPYIQKISFHAGPHQFKIKLNEDCRAVLTYKKWSTDNNWETCASVNDGILLTWIPDGKPETERADPKKLPALSIEGLMNDYKACAAQLMSPDEDKWWNNFLDEAQKLEGIFFQILYCPVMFLLI